MSVKEPMIIKQFKVMPKPRYKFTGVFTSKTSLEMSLHITYTPKKP